MRIDPAVVLQELDGPAGGLHDRCLRQSLHAPRLARREARVGAGCGGRDAVPLPTDDPGEWSAAPGERSASPRRMRRELPTVAAGGGNLEVVLLDVVVAEEHHAEEGVLRTVGTDAA